MLPLRQRNQILLFLLFSAVQVDVVRAKRIVCSDRDADGAVYARQLFDDGRIFNIAHPRPAIFFREDDARQTEFCDFRPELNRKMLRLVPLHDVRRDLRFGKLAHAPLDL